MVSTPQGLSDARETEIRCVLKGFGSNGSFRRRKGLKGPALPAPLLLELEPFASKPRPNPNCPQTLKRFENCLKQALPTFAFEAAPRGSKSRLRLFSKSYSSPKCAPSPHPQRHPEEDRQVRLEGSSRMLRSSLPILRDARKRAPQDDAVCGGPSDILPARSLDLTRP